MEKFAMQRSLAINIILPSGASKTLSDILIDEKVDLKKTHISQFCPRAENQRNNTCGLKALEVAADWGFPDSKLPRARKHAKDPSAKEKEESKSLPVSLRQKAKSLGLTGIGEIYDVGHFKVLTNDIEELKASHPLQYTPTESESDIEKYTEWLCAALQDHSVIVSVDIGKNGFPAENKGNNTHWVLAWGIVTLRDTHREKLKDKLKDNTYILVTHWGKHYLWPIEKLYASNKQLPAMESARQGQYRKIRQDDKIDYLKIKEGEMIPPGTKLYTVKAASLDNFRFTGFAVPAPPFKDALLDFASIEPADFIRAIKKNNLQLIDHILSLNPQILEKNFQGKTLWEIIIEITNKALFDLLLSKGLEPSTPFTQALLKVANPESVGKKIILELSKHKFTQDELSQLLYMAVKSATLTYTANTELISFLLEKGAVPLIHSAIKQNDREVFLEFLAIAKEEDINSVESEGDTPFILAIKEKKMEYCLDLLNHKDFKIILNKSACDLIITIITLTSSGYDIQLMSNLLTLFMNKQFKQILIELKKYIETFPWEIKEVKSSNTITAPEGEIKVPSEVYLHWRKIVDCEQKNPSDEIWATLFFEILRDAHKAQMDLKDNEEKTKSQGLFAPPPVEPDLPPYLSLLTAKRHPLILHEVLHQQNKENAKECGLKEVKPHS